MAYKNGSAYYGERKTNYVSLSYMPSPRQENIIGFPRLDGGLNLWELDYRLNVNESPDMKNVWWKDGVLCSRTGQEWYINDGVIRGSGHACYDGIYHGNAFFHIGNKIYSIDMEAESRTLEEVGALTQGDTDDTVRGTFFVYDDKLYYKTRGVYKEIAYTETDGAGTFVMTDVEAYSPITVINADPSTGAGDIYQPANRLSSTKTIWYTPKTVEKVRTQTVPSDESGRFYPVRLNDISKLKHILQNGNTLINGVDYIAYLDPETNPFQGKEETCYKAPTVYFVNGFSENDILEFVAECNVRDYYLPEIGAELISIEVDGEEYYTEKYTYDSSLGKITFASGCAPKVDASYALNIVRITYKTNTDSDEDAVKSIMDCRYAAVYGGETSMCIVLGGCENQPNAYFWNGNHAVMDPGYFPIDQYNLAGDSYDEITGFGKQNGNLIILKNHSVGKASLGSETVFDRLRLTLNYISINTAVGCDMPWSVQLVENNIVFCNSRLGAYIIRDSSAAYENNIQMISRNVNGSDMKRGLINVLHEEKEGGRTDSVCSFDDGDRYWIVAGGNAYAWDYTVSTAQKPSWFYFTNINATGFFADDKGGQYHMNKDGNLTKLINSFTDYGGAIEKKYRFATVFFDTYDRLKDVTGIMFVTRSDTATFVDVNYITDYGNVRDRTPLTGYRWCVSPRNLSYRSLKSTLFGNSEKRRPGLRHIRHFSMELTNNSAGQDMSVVSAQVYFKYAGRER